MSTSEHPGQDFQANESQASISDIDARSELAQSALEAAQLVIARWTRASRFPYLQTAATLGGSVQARFYARAQKDLQAWIDRGGFSQQDCPSLSIREGKFHCEKNVSDSDDRQCANACYD